VVQRGRAAAGDPVEGVEGRGPPTSRDAGGEDRLTSRTRCIADSVGAGRDSSRNSPGSVALEADDDLLVVIPYE